jgi:uncharacterized membrane protein YeaQ/YmgE (transglycosylase-associated protein family)
MDLMSLVVSLVSGIVGGNVAGAAMHDKSLGPIGNSLAGLLGGGAGSVILQALGLLTGSGAGAGGLDVGSLIGNIAGSGVGGALMLLIVSLIKSAAAKA